METLDKLKGLTIDSITFDCSLANRSQSTLGQRSGSKPSSYSYERPPYDHTRQTLHPRPSYPSYPYSPAPSAQANSEPNNYMRREINAPASYSMSAAAAPFVQQLSSVPPSYCVARGPAPLYPPPHQQHSASANAQTYYPYLSVAYSMPPYEGHSHPQHQPQLIHEVASVYLPRSRPLERLDEYQSFGAQPSVSSYLHADVASQAGQQASASSSPQFQPHPNY
ncbi:hypothetical protein EON65_42685 [archaeon]|nr:MAG: hypothetical protein EON65_42685 [archaeon]